MTDAPDREAIHRRARAMAVRMGHAKPADAQETAQGPAFEPLPNVSPKVLRALMNRGHLTPGQTAAARHLFKEAARIAREDPSA